MIAYLRLLSVMVALLAVAAPAGAAQVVANFDGYNSTAVVDAYLGKAGDGWASPWQTFLGATGATLTGAAVQSGDAGYSEVTTGGGTYLAASLHPTSGTSGKSGSISRSYAGGTIDITLPHSVEFDLRVDEDLAANFTTTTDRYWFYDDPAPAQGGNYTNSWLIGVFGASGTGIPTAKSWLLYDAGLGTWNVDSGIALQTGVVYHFKVDVDPATRTWGATISDGTNSFTNPSPLPWRTNAATVGARPQICQVAHTTADTRKCSFDNVKVTGSAVGAPAGGMSGISAYFRGGNSTTEVDGYLGAAGAGWKTPWSQVTNSTTITASVLSPGDAGFNELESGGGRYLSYSAKQTVASPISRGESATLRDYKTTTDPGIDWSEGHAICFTLRIDETMGTGTTFSAVNDRYQIFDSPVAEASPGPGCTWMISAYGAATGECPAGMAKEWGLYNGLRDGGVIASAQYVDTNIALTTGVAYDFTIVVHPSTQSYDATVSNGATSFTATGLGWRTVSPTIGGNVTFATGASALNEIRTFSLDAVAIMVPEPAAGVLVFLGALTLLALARRKRA